MVNSLKMLVTIILLIITFGFFSIYRTSDRQDELAMVIVKQAVQTFADTVRSKGYIDNRDYSELQAKLDSTGLTFETSLEYLKKRYQPLYVDPNDFYTFTEEYETMFEGYYTLDILSRLFPNNGKPDNDVSRRYNMSDGDLFYVRVNSLDTDFTAKIGSIFVDRPEIPKAWSAGGMVRNEAP